MMSRIMKSTVLCIAVCFCFVFLFAGKKKENEPIRIGGIISTTNPFGTAAEGVELRDGLMLAVEEINGRNGIKGKKIKFIFEDCGQDSDRASDIFERMEKEYRPLFYVSSHSSVSLVLSRRAEDHGVVLVSLVAPSPRITVNKKWTYRYWVTAESELPVYLALLERLKVEDLGVIYLNDDFGTSYYSNIKESFELGGGSVEGTYFPVTEANFYDDVQRFLKKDAIFAVGFESHLAVILKEIRDAGFKKPVLSVNALCSPTIRKLPQLDGVYMPAPLIYNRRYLYAHEAADNYGNRFGKPFNHYAAAGYDLLTIISNLLENEEPTRENIRVLLEGGFIHSGVFGDVVLQEGDHDIDFPERPARILDGEVEY